MYYTVVIYCIDQSTTAPGWPNQSIGPNGTAERIDIPPLPSTRSTVTTQEQETLTTPTTNQGTYVSILVKMLFLYW